MAFPRARTRSGAAIVCLAILGLGLGACATTKREADATRGGAKAGGFGDAIGGAVSQPFRDLSLVRETTPPVLVDAVAAPYGSPHLGDCPAITAELTALEAALGGDIDGQDVARATPAQDLVTDAVRSAVGLPFRGTIRKVTGAERRDRAHARAVLAGMVRRGFLKGLALAAGCPAADTT